MHLYYARHNHESSPYSRSALKLVHDLPPVILLAVIFFYVLAMNKKIYIYIRHLNSGKPTNNLTVTHAHSSEMQN